MEPPHVAFVLTSTGTDIHAQRARLAITSLRFSEPRAKVTIACDEVTASMSWAGGGHLRGLADDLLVVSCPPGDAAFRSRFVKTSLPTRIDGPFSFLDLDVLVRGPLDAIRATGADVAAVHNHCTADPARQVGARDRAILGSMGWGHGPGRYFNTGVLHFTGTPESRGLGEAWHQRWMASASASGDHLDQPAFNSALHTMPRVHIAPLPHRFNAQVRMALPTYEDAVVWHFYSAIEAPFTGFDAEARRLHDGGDLVLGRVRKLMDAPHPWKADGPLDRLVLHYAMRHGHMFKWCRYWLQGRRAKAIAWFVRWLYHGVLHR